MRIALHPTINDPITIDEYWVQFGHRPLLGDDTRKRARCPFCSQILNDVAGRSGHTVGHFAHLRGSGPCPSKAPAGRPYYPLTPVDSDLNRSRLLQGDFFANWERYYRKLENLVPCLSKKGFLALVAEANRLRIWEYRHLEPWEIPYVFVLMVDFPTTNSRLKDGKPQRVFWFRFWYDASVQSIDDLWIRRDDEPTLFRASFIQPKRRGVTPKYEALVKFYLLDRERDYLTKPTDPLPNWLCEEVEQALWRLLDF